MFVEHDENVADDQTVREKCRLTGQKYNYTLTTCKLLTSKYFG